MLLFEVCLILILLAARALLIKGVVKYASV